MKKIVPLAAGIDKVIYNGVLKEELTTLDDDARVHLKDVRNLTSNIVQKKSVLREQRKILEGYTMPFLSRLLQYEQNDLIQTTLYKKMRFGKADFKAKYILKHDLGQVYAPYVSKNPSYLPFRYECNPNKALRDSSSFIPFFNELMNSAEHLRISELHLNFDFPIALSQWIVINTNQHRRHNDSYKNTTYWGYQQKSPIRHALYNKKSELQDRAQKAGKNTDTAAKHLPNDYYRYEVRLRNAETVLKFATDKDFQKKVLSELVFIKAIPTLEEICSMINCTVYRAEQVLQVIQGDICLFTLEKRAKKEVAEILQQLNQIELAIDTISLTPYLDVCKGFPLQMEQLPNTLIGETMVCKRKENSVVNAAHIASAGSVQITNASHSHRLSGEKTVHFLTCYVQSRMDKLTLSGEI